MKFKTTAKAIKEGYAKVYSVGYCDLETLLRYEEPVAYTAGVYGWNANIYQLNNYTALVTGYRPFGGHIDYQLVKEYENRARGILDKEHYSKHKELFSALLQEFVEKVVEE